MAPKVDGRSKTPPPLPPRPEATKTQHSQNKPAVQQNKPAVHKSDTPPATGYNHVTNQETGKLDAKQTAEHIANNVAHSEETAALTAADQKLQQQRYGNNLAIKQSDDQLVDAMTRGKNFHDKASQAAGA